MTEISYCEHGSDKNLCILCHAPPGLTKAAIELAEQIEDARDEVVDAAKAAVDIGLTVSIGGAMAKQRLERAVGKLRALEKKKVP